MSDVLTATEVANVLTFVAPGFFALGAYRFEFPRRPRERFETLVVSAAASVPLVALTELIRDWLGVNRNPLGPGYVALLLGVSIVSGYGFARLRGSATTRRALRKAGLRQEPEDTPFLRVLRGLSDPEAQATVTFKDGAILSGTPSLFTSDLESPRELFVTNPRWWVPEIEEWTPRTDGGVLVSLDQVWAIEFNRTPQ
jgi:hypothetical protein